MSGPKNQPPKETSAEDSATSAKPATSAKSSTKSASRPDPAPVPTPESTSEDNDESTAAATTAQAQAAVSDAVGAVRERLVTGEQFVLAAAVSIVVVAYLIFEFLLDYRVLSDFAVLLAVLTILAIWVHRWGHYDFGNGYRIIIGALGVAMALLAVMNLLAWARLGGGSTDFLHFIGRLIYWAGGVAAFYGAWTVFRTREN